MKLKCPSCGTLDPSVRYRLDEFDILTACCKVEAIFANGDPLDEEATEDLFRQQEREVEAEMSEHGMSIPRRIPGHQP